MWGSSEEPPGTMEAGPPEPVANLNESYEQNKNQLESLKDIMLRSKQSLKKKEEELQEYAKVLNKIKTRSKTSRPIKEDAMSSSESTPKSKSDSSTAEPSDSVDDISQARTPKAKSSLLQKKLAEDRKIFEQRSKELTESKRAVEEKVEALRQQLEEKYVAPVSVVTPVLVTSQTAHPVLEVSLVQDKDNKITELNNKIFELEAIIIDLQDNLKEKDSVIDSKTKAITLMSADLSKKGKTTLDTLEDTKDEMRSMQENFVLVETSLRSKNENLLKQLEDKSEQISTLEKNIKSLTQKIEVQKEAEVVSADFSRSTMDTLADTKDAMKSMQENFVLVETSLKSKNEHLLKQLEEREIKLAEAEARILHLETGMGIERLPNMEDLMYKIGNLEEVNKMLQDEKYELQKRIADMQDKIVSNQPSISNDEIKERDNKIIELEGLIEELKKVNQSLKEDNNHVNEQIVDLNRKNEEMSRKVIDLEKQVEDLENTKSELTKKLSATESEVPKEDEKVQKLTKELDDLNKSMIKLKAQHKNKLKNLQKQLENFKKVSDTNAELVKLGNQVALLEEEKGNLQLSLVDFDELKASAGDWQERISDLEGKVSAQAKEIQTHIEAIAILENQKLDLMQELHVVKQEVSSLEAENAESENLRVSAEMKVVDLEEELESLHRQQPTEPVSDVERAELQRQIASLTQENERLSQKLNKQEELKSSSEVGSTESFVKTGSNVDSTESFEALSADADRADLLKRIDGLTRENGALMEKLTRYEEKGSSDTGSTESFERIPEQGETSSKLENLTKENYELVVRLTKLEEKLAASEPSDVDSQLRQDNERLIAELAQLQESLSQLQMDKDEEVQAREKREIEGAPSTETEVQAQPSLYEENERLRAEVTQLREKLAQIEESQTVSPTDPTPELLAKVESLTALNDSLTASLEELEREKQVLSERLLEKPSVDVQEDTKKAETIAWLESEIERLNGQIAEHNEAVEDMRTKLADKETELERSSSEKENVQALRRELEESASVIAEWKLKCAALEDKMSELETSKQRIEEALLALQEENRSLMEQSETKESMIASLREELDNTITRFELKLQEHSEIVGSQEKLIDELRAEIENKDKQLQTQYQELQSDLNSIGELQDELRRLDGQLQQRDATIASLSEELETLRTNSSVAEEDLFTARHQLAQLHERLENSKNVEEYNRLAERLNEKEMQVEELETRLSQRVAEVKELKAHADSFAEENQRLIERAKEEERRVADLLQDNRHQEEALGDAERARAEVENRLLDLQAVHEEHLNHANNISVELQNAYTSLEQLKIKHTDDMQMLNRRLDDALEELLERQEEASRMEAVIEEKTMLLQQSVSQEVKATLEAQVVDLERKLAEAEAKSQAQLEKMKKYAAVAKKKTALCEELETKLTELQAKLSQEQEASGSQHRDKDNRITELEEELRHMKVERDDALHRVDSLNSELAQSKNFVSTLTADLDVVKENARELGVRMAVVEGEYVEQLGQINNLRTENGFLHSKQAQLHERLEIAEKEADDRRIEIERLTRERETTCPTCAGLEAKLQEREAEIENLDNELHNSIGNLVQMQENLRLSTIAPAPDSNYNELAMRYEELRSAGLETEAKYEAIMRENADLIERVTRLQDLNATAHARIAELEREAAKDREVAAAFEKLSVEHQALLERFEQQRLELEEAREQLQEKIAKAEAAEKQLLTRLEAQREPVVETMERQKREVDESPKEASPPLFDGSLFGATPIQTSDSEHLLKEELNALNRQLEDTKVMANEEIQQARLSVETLKAELDTNQNELEALRGKFVALQEEHRQTRSSLEENNARIEQAEMDKNLYLAQLEQLNPELAQINELLYSPDDSSATTDKLRRVLDDLAALRDEKYELDAALEVHKRRIVDLEAEVRVSGESVRITELENRIAQMIGERDILQLQATDVTRAYDEAQQSVVILQTQLEAAAQEKSRLVEQLENLKLQSPSVPEPVVASTPHPTTVESSALELGAVDSATVESMWDDDEDPWNQSSHEHEHIPVVPSAEIQLRMKVDELEDKLKELTEENSKLVEEGRLAQLKNVKYVKKLKEYKVQLDGLQRQLKSQGSFGDLDSAIEEELKTQLATLEKSLAEAKEDLKKAAAEKENLLKRIETLTAATEHFTDAKERQDNEIYIWQMRYKELEARFQQPTSPPPEASPMESSQKLEEEIRELKENVDALAAENEELQQLLEEHRGKRQACDEESAVKVQELQVKLAEASASYGELQQQHEQSLTASKSALDDLKAQLADAKANQENLHQQHQQSLDEANNRVQELEGKLVEMKNNYDALRKQYEQGMMDADEQVFNMRQNSELLREEFAAQQKTMLEEKAELESRIHELETQVNQLEERVASISELEEQLQKARAQEAELREELSRLQMEKSQLEENGRVMEQQLREELVARQAQLDNAGVVMRDKQNELSKCSLERAGSTDKLHGLELTVEGYVTQLQEKEQEVGSLREQVSKLEAANKEAEKKLAEHLEQAAVERQESMDRERELSQRLHEAETRITELSAALTVGEASLVETKARLETLLQEQSACVKEVASKQEATKFVEEMPVFTFPGGSSDQELQMLQAQLKVKEQEIERLQHALSDNALQNTLQELQDNINILYNEKSELEEQLAAKDQEISTVKSQLQESHRERRSLGEQHELMKLQNELHARSQELNELRYLLAEKESQLRLAMEQAAGGADEHDAAEGLRNELFESRREMERLQQTVSELQSEIAGLRGLARLADDDRETIQRLGSEKEQVRREAEVAVQRILTEKEAEIDSLKQQMAAEIQSLREALGLRERDVQNLKVQLEQTGLDREVLLERNAEQLVKLESEISERDRRLAELSITKDAELHNLRMQLGEKTIRFEELAALSEEEERQLAEMRKILDVKEQQIGGLTQQLDEKTKEYEVIQNALQRHVGKVDQVGEPQAQQQPSASSSESSFANDLDWALYMLHQRDVRCEELTHELIQLLEERDTLQLRLSNAIRINEELRRHATAANSSPKKDSMAAGVESAEPPVEYPSPSSAEGPVEIAKEAIHSPMDEDRKALAQKLSQLKNVDQGKDVRLRDERETRHYQQMSLLTHGDVLSKLPPEAAARLVNANYTLSRDVQSQSSVLLNWLWGKSTPKVVHM